jgi:pyruvate kinase
MRNTKIVCTLGPASNNLETVCALLDAGMNVVRLNFSHGKHEQHAESIQIVKKAAKNRNRMTPIIADLQGPKIRTGRLEGDQPVMLLAGARVRLTNQPVLGNAALISIDYPTLANDVNPGDRILINDGAIELRVTAIEAGDVICEIAGGGLLAERKGVNVPSNSSCNWSTSTLIAA